MRESWQDVQHLCLTILSTAGCELNVNRPQYCTIITITVTLA